MHWHLWDVGHLHWHRAIQMLTMVSRDTYVETRDPPVGAPAAGL
jgi:hypothetical protein